MSDAPARIGPYTVLGALGRGGMGAVLRVRRDDLDKEFALKIIYSGDGAEPGAGDAEAVARFAREAQAQAKLADHPGIVGVHDAGTVDGKPYLIMDLVAGRALDEVLEDEPLAPVQAAAMAVKIARAVAYAHDHDILHRDLKPGNVMVDPAGEPHVTDFGLARPRTATPESLRLTRSGEILGTPAYMPPEQALGRRVDVRADVFSLGATLYEMVVGAPPFGDGELVTVLGKVLRAPPDPPAVHGVDLPRPLEAIIRCCLEKRPADRYATAEALAEDLQRFLDGLPVRARRPGAGRRIARAAQARPLLTAVVLAAPLAAAGALWWSGRQEQATEAASTTIEQHSAATAQQERAAAVNAAWTAAWRELGADAQRLEDHFNGVAVPVAERQAIVNRMGPAAGRLAAAHPNGRSAPAIWIVAQLQAGAKVDQAQIDLLLTGDADPIPHIWVAKLHLTQWMHDIRRPVTEVAGGAHTRGFTETPFMLEMRGRAERDLAAATSHELWPWLNLGDGFRAFVEGALALAAGRFTEAAERLAAAVDDPVVGSEAGTLRAHALLYDTQFAAAGRAAEQAAARGWPRTSRLAGFAWMLEGYRLHAAKQAPWDAFDRAAVMFQAAIDLDPSRGDWRHDLALLHWGKSQVAEARRENPIPHYEAAIAEHTRALERDTRGEHGPILVNRAKAAVSLGYYLLNQRRDPTAALTAAIADFRLVREQFPGLTDADQFEADAHAGLARHANRPASDPQRPLEERIAAYRAALVHYRRAADTAPEHPRYLVELGGAGVNFGAFLARHKQDADPVLAQAVADLTRALELDANAPQARLFRGNGYGQIARHRARTERTFVEVFEQAFGDYTEALAQAAAPAAAERLAWSSALIELGGLYHMAKRDGGRPFEQAVALLDPLVAAQPSNATARHYRGMARTGLLLNFLQIRRQAPGHAALARAAKADLEQAARLQPSLAPGFRPHLAAIDRYLATHGK